MPPEQKVVTDQELLEALVMIHQFVSGGFVSDITRARLKAGLGEVPSEDREWLVDISKTARKLSALRLPNKQMGTFKEEA